MHVEEFRAGRKRSNLNMARRLKLAMREEGASQKGEQDRVKSQETQEAQGQNGREGERRKVHELKKFRGGGGGVRRAEKKQVANMGFIIVTGDAERA